RETTFKGIESLAVGLDNLLKSMEIDNSSSSKPHFEASNDNMLFCRYCKKNGHDMYNCWKRAHNNAQTDSNAMNLKSQSSSKSSFNPSESKKYPENPSRVAIPSKIPTKQIHMITQTN